MSSTRYLSMFFGLYLIFLVSAEAQHAEAQKDRKAKREDHAAFLLRKLEDPEGGVMIVAHRGDWRNAPENSLPAIENCIRMGLDVVEIDIKMTKDGRLVLMHDKTLERTTTGSGKVKDLTLDEIKKLYLLNGYGMPTAHRVPTLEEAMILARGKILVYIDKSDYLIDKVYAVLEKTGTESQSLFYGEFTWQQLLEKYGALVKKIRYIPKLNEKTKEPGKYIDDFITHANPPAFITDFSNESSPMLAYMDQIRKKGVRVWVTTLWPESCAGHDDEKAVDNADASWGWVIGKGASMLCTDRPALMNSYLTLKKINH